MTRALPCLLLPALAVGLVQSPPVRAHGDSAARHVPPKPLGGAWQATADCSGGEMLRLEFRPEAVQAAGSFGETSCAYAGLRQMTPTRWYVDLDCTGGRPVRLDINALADGRLLVAERPLGAACFYARPGR